MEEGQLGWVDEKSKESKSFLKAVMSSAKECTCAGGGGEEERNWE